MIEPRQLLKLASVSIENWRSIDAGTIDFRDGVKGRKRTVILGENGAGKTSILRAIALSSVPLTEATALAAQLVGTQRRLNKRRNLAEQAVLVAQFVDDDDPEAVYEVTTRVVEGADRREEFRRTTIPAEFPWHRIVIAGYGVGRGIRGGGELGAFDRRQAMLSLFDDRASLLDPEGVLKSIKLDDPSIKLDVPQAPRGRRGRPAPQFPTLEYFQHVVRKLFRLPAKIAIDVTGTGTLVHGPWGAQPFHALGDGYRSTAGWVLDFLGRAYAAKADMGQEPRGIVLIDEVDEHLHPSWAREILGLLQEVLPEVQFIATTHSPVTIVETRPEEVVLVEQSNTKVDIHQSLPETAAQTMDALLRGQWFGLEKIMDEETEALLKSYKEALKTATIGPELDEARFALMMRAPALCATPIEEMAIRAAAKVQAEPGRTTVPELNDVVAELRAQLAAAREAG